MTEASIHPCGFPVTPFTECNPFQPYQLGNWARQHTLTSSCEVQDLVIRWKKYASVFLFNDSVPSYFHVTWAVVTRHVHKGVFVVLLSEKTVKRRRKQSSKKYVKNIFYDALSTQCFFTIILHRREYNKFNKCT